MRLHEPISAWHTEHVHFNGLLERLRGQLDAFHRGERPDYERICETVAYLREFGDAVHHPREDVAFQRLAKHCPDMALPLARLQQEHRVIVQAGETGLRCILRRKTGPRFGRRCRRADAGRRMRVSATIAPC